MSSTFVGAPSLGVDPFRRGQPARRRVEEDEMPANYGTGFSPDGQSYSVIDDFGKIAAQALAEYEARIKNPRNDIWGKTLHEDTPEFLDQTILEPVRRLIGGSQNTTSPVKTFEMGHDLVQYDPRTGQTKVAFKGPEAPVKTQRYAGATGVDIMGKPTGNVSLTPQEWAGVGPGLPDNIRTNEPIASYINWGNQSNNVPATVQGPKAPPMYADWPQQGNFIGAPGGTNRFSGSLTNSTKRVLKYNPKTGNLE